MKVICRTNNINDKNLAPDASMRVRRYVSMPDGELNLEIDKEYVVYGIELRDGCPWFYLCDEEYDEYPLAYAADFFEIADRHLSAYWQLNYKCAGINDSRTQLVFSEWALDENFYENLVSGEQQAVATFAKFRKLMDAE
ncbi:hypothetical protein FBY06_14338 [Pseudomonas sp. SJZ085]|uniref:hypothetical protein n=2 Tax=Pseudomonas TaxID=286 RepID=UPI001198FDC8|nr:hypothetical protein [Pseudomonas sp. SJZ074]TWC11563.1 hypothetical protein FBX99_14338 [Pseudomonas sp. SJZ074]TWC30277.1 hypothetical protein FBY06_14338 [Pseudomonas sp. SJZ085]